MANDMTVDFIARFITDDPCLFNEEQIPTPSGAPTQSEINAAAQKATGLEGDAAKQLSDETKAAQEKKDRENKLRADKLNPLFDRANDELEQAVIKASQAYGNSGQQKDTLEQGRDDLTNLRNMMQSIADVATRG